MKVLDTDTCIAILRGQLQVIDRRARKPDAVATTWMTAAELHFGAAKSIAPEANGALVDEFLATLLGPAARWRTAVAHRWGPGPGCRRKRARG